MSFLGKAKAETSSQYPWYYLLSAVVMLCISVELLDLFYLDRSCIYDNSYWKYSNLLTYSLILGF